MSYRIVVDSCCDFPIGYDLGDKIVKIPLFFQVNGENIIDDETFNQLEFIRKIKEAPECPKSSCPSPQSYMDAYDCDAEDVFVVTLSSKLSGSYNSAELGKSMFFEEKKIKKNIHVVNSCSASVGQSRIAMKIREMAENGSKFPEIVREIEKFTLEQDTYFVLESLEILRKNGRLTGLQAIMANVLNIKPIMGVTDEGVIIKLDQARGIEKSLAKMIKYINERTSDQKNKTLALSHCNNLQRAQFVKTELEKITNFKEILIAEMAGVSTMYANDGGIIVSV